MTKITITDLKQISERNKSTSEKFKASLLVCAGTGCVANKAFIIRDALEKELKEKNLESDYRVIATGCNGFCAQGPLMLVSPEGTLYLNLKLDDVSTIVDEHLINGKPVQDLMYISPVDETRTPKMKDIQFFKQQQLIILRNRGAIDPEQIDDYIGRGGYQALAHALSEMKPNEILNEVKTSGIRGRGGGGFPTGIKWESCISSAKKTDVAPYLVCNADEGDPGAFMDRSIIEADPHSVIEGMAIGAYAIGAKEGFVYIRKEYPLALERLRKAIQQARDYGLLGQKIFDTDFSFDINIHQGAGAFVSGESSALMTAMEGKVGEPHSKYIHTVESGYKGLPTVLNNVETWANIPVIIEKGGKWFSKIGSGDVSESPWKGSSGTKVFSLVGDIANTGLVEVPMGITLEEIVNKIGGGVPEGRQCKAVQTGGPSGGCIPADLLNLPVDFDTLTQAGSMMGSGGLIVMDDSRCMVDVAKYFIDFLVEESCGKCTPCREGLVIIKTILARVTNGLGEPSDLEMLSDISETIKNASLCDLGGSAPNPALSTLKYFKDEYKAHIIDKKCPAGVCKALIQYTISKENCNGCGVCPKHCPEDAISGEKKELHTIDQSKCVKCGICREVCKFDAVEVE
ncbi:MAG: 4Fe-4S binding protein [Thermoplasmata archaeon]|nr:MAG: 4Fe-4S binding protein [Thermoplasmata archaeon]